MNAITLHKMKFFAYHGVGEQERVVGNHFEVTLKVYCPMEKAMTDDDLDGTVNYADLYATVEAEMAQPSLLLENVAYRITQAVKISPPSQAEKSPSVNSPLHSNATWKRWISPSNFKISSVGTR